MKLTDASQEGEFNLILPTKGEVNLITLYLAESHVVLRARITPPPLFR